MAIQPTNAGIDFQQRVSALMMILMEFEIDINAILSIDLRDQIQKLNFEAIEKIDDLVMTTVTNRKIYMQMKRNISFSEETTSEFYSVCAQFVRQYVEGNPEDLAYVLVTRTQASSSITVKLKRILDGIRLANTINIKSNLNKNEIALLEKFERIMQAEYERVSGNAISESVLKNLLSKIYVEVFDVEAGEGFEKHIKLILHSRLEGDVEQFWGMLISKAVQYAANRNCLDKDAFHKQIEKYRVTHEDTEKTIKIEWEEDNTDIAIQKDYVIALGNCEINREIGLENPDENVVLIMELYRFNNGKKKDSLQYVAPNIMKWGNDFSFEILFRCSSRSRIEKYIADGGLAYYIDDYKKVIYVPTRGEFDKEKVEVAYEDLIKKSISSKKECKCVNCGKAIFDNEAYSVEIDNVECSGQAGLIHKECIRPIDRVLGIAKIPSARNYGYLKNFDINLWIKLIVKGKQAWGNINSLQQNISPFVVDTDEVFTDGKYCVRTVLSDGNVRYAINRGVIHRMSRTAAEDFAKQLTERYQEANMLGNPICYSSETYVYGPYEQLLVQMDGKEELLECICAEVAFYNDTIAKMYNESETYYAPVIYLSVEGEPVIFDGIFPLITNPLELNYYLGNWKKAGITIENYEVNIIKEDSDFILKILSLISNGIRPIVDMIIGKDRRLIKGCVIHTMRELEEMHYMEELDNDDCY